MTILDDALYMARLVRRLPSPSMRRLLREQAGVTQEAVASEVGVDRASVTRWELGERTPRGALLEAYVKVLDRLAREEEASDAG